MVDRRRPTKFGLTLAFSALLLVFGPAHAAATWQLQSSQTALRFEVPDSLYAAGISSSFSGLQISDASGTNLAYAACAPAQIQIREYPLDVLPWPDLGRPVLNSDNSISFSRPVGARPASEAEEWLLDLRGVEATTGTLKGLPAIDKLRISPNLHQWSGAVDFQQAAEQVSFQPSPLKFIRVTLHQATSLNSAPPVVTATVEHRSGERQPHWFKPQSLSDGNHHYQRKLPVFAARITNPDAQGWTLQSRQGDWDAWKTRGRLEAGAQANVMRFSAVSDPFWRVQGNDTAQLQLAHARYELRIPTLPANSSLNMRFHHDQALRPRYEFGPSLSCRTTETMPASAPQSIRVIDNSSENAGKNGTGNSDDHRPNNLRLMFLILLATLVSIGLVSAAVLNWRKRR